MKGLCQYFKVAWFSYTLCKGRTSVWEQLMYLLGGAVEQSDNQAVGHCHDNQSAAKNV